MSETNITTSVEALARPNRIVEEAHGDRQENRRRLEEGRPGRVAAAVKEAILVAFDEVGGKDYLIGVARSNPEVFCRLLAKVLPVQLAGDPEQPIKAMLSIEAHRERALAIIRKAFEPYVEHEGPRPLMPPPKLVQ